MNGGGECIKTEPSYACLPRGWEKNYLDCMYGCSLMLAPDFELLENLNIFQCKWKCWK